MRVETRNQQLFFFGLKLFVSGVDPGGWLKSGGTLQKKRGAH